VNRADQEREPTFVSVDAETAGTTTRSEVVVSAAAVIGTGLALCFRRGRRGWTFAARSGAEESQSGQDPAMIGLRLVQVELSEDAGDVLFNNAFGDHEFSRDRCVGAARRRQGEHLLLAGAQHR